MRTRPLLECSPYAVNLAHRPTLGMPDFALDVEALLNPISGASPSGDDLAYDAQFASLEQAGAGKPESQYGDKVFPAEPPDWPAVYEHATALAQRTRDL